MKYVLSITCPPEGQGKLNRTSAFQLYYGYTYIFVSIVKILSGDIKLSK